MSVCNYFINKMPQQLDSLTDVLELSALLQCLGFTVTSLDTNDVNLSQDGGGRIVSIHCQSSGLRVVMESSSVACSCPGPEKQNSGFWQVCGVTGGKQAERESGSALLGSLPKAHRERLSKELREMVRCIKDLNDYEEPERSMDIAGQLEGNKSHSMVELSTPPEKKHLLVKVDTPTRYRSLDTLTSARSEAECLPPPGALQKDSKDASVDDDKTDDKKAMCSRQSTYTVSSTPGSVRRRNKTSSPIQQCPSMLDKLMAAEKSAEELRNKLTFVIREYMDEGRNDDSSMSSLALDVSKISVLKGADNPKSQFASSPNLSGLGSTREELTKSRLKRFESVSTSSLGKPSPKEGKISKLKRISPNIFRLKKDSPSVKDDGKGSKLNSLFKARVTTPPVRKVSEASPNPSSASKKKFSHIKSTIPRPTPKKE